MTHNYTPVFFLFLSSEKITFQHRSKHRDRLFQTNSELFSMHFLDNKSSSCVTPQANGKVNLNIPLSEAGVFVSQLEKQTDIYGQTKTFHVYILWDRNKNEMFQISGCIAWNIFLKNPNFVWGELNYIGIFPDYSGMPLIFRRFQTMLMV